MILADGGYDTHIVGPLYKARSNKEPDRSNDRSDHTVHLSL